MINPGKLSKVARALLDDSANDLYFSAASLCEIAIKSSLGSDDFQVDPQVFRRNLVDNGYVELLITTGHALAVLSLPPIHKDPFDRMLIAQAMVEGVTLLTVDRPMTLYPGAIRRV